MEKLRATALKPGVRLDRAVFHSSGEVLLEAGGTVSAEIARLLGESGIGEVFRPEPGEDAGEFVHSARNQMMSVGDLKVGQRVTKPIFDRSGALLAEAGTVVTERMAAGLRRRSVERIYVRKTTAELGLEQVQAFRRGLRRVAGTPPAPVQELLDPARFLKPEDCTPRRIDELLDSGGEVQVPVASEPLLEKLRQHDPLEGRARSAKDGFLIMYEEAAVCTATVLKAFEANRDVEPEQVSKLARQVIGGLVEDRDLLLNLSNIRSDSNYLVGHSLAVTILAIAAAAARGYSRRLVLEMAHAAYLHDIGMLRVPGAIVEQAGRLAPMEVTEVRRHPIYGLDMLQRLVGRRSGLALSVPMVVYQSHERENGSGYPKGRRGRVIHDFAKIVAACDVYQALTSRRPWRPAMLPYTGMEQLVLMGARREMDPEVVRAVLACVQLFPIGSWVELADGSRGRVVAASGSNYARPVVSLTERRGAPLAAPQRVNLAEHRDLEVVRPIPAPGDAIEPMEGF